MATLSQLVGIRSQKAEGLRHYYDWLIAYPNREDMRPKWIMGERSRTGVYVKPDVWKVERPSGREEPRREQPGEEDVYGEGRRDARPVPWQAELQRAVQRSAAENSGTGDAQPPWRAVLLGPPGQGKSLTSEMSVRLLARMARRQLTTARVRLDQLPLPIVVSLAELARPERGIGPDQLPEEALRLALEGCLRNQGCPVAAYLAAHAHETRAWLFLDGLDEVEANLHPLPRYFEVLQGWRCQIVVSSRPHGYDAWQLDIAAGKAALHEYRLAPFNANQVDQFIGRWFSEEAGAGRLEELRSRNEAVRRLSEVPYLLTLLCGVAVSQDIPETVTRGQLYESALELALGGEERAAYWWPLLQALGFEMFTANHRQPRIARGPLLARLAGHPDEPPLPKSHAADQHAPPLVRAEHLLEELSRQRVLVKLSGGGLHGFGHRSIPAFLAARHLMTRCPHEEFVRLFREDHEQWWEPGLLAGSWLALPKEGDRLRTPNAVWKLLEALCPAECDESARHASDDIPFRLAWLAGEIVLENNLNAERGTRSAELGTRNSKPETRNTLLIDRIRVWLVALIKGGRLPVKERARAGEVLGWLGDPRPGVGLRPDGLPDIEWVEIPAGPFIMGSKKGETDYDNETPQMKDCTLIWQPYRISRYQVTVAQYQAFVETGGYRQERFWQWSAEALAWFRENQGAGPASNSQVFLTPNSPRVGVNWFEAVAFCHWLSERTGQSITLPTEAQWERAARHTDGRAYPWGNSAADLAQRCNMWDTGIGHTSAVGLFPSGKAECGACDLSGNVWEWCRTKWRGDYVNYQTKVDDGLSGEDACVARGGSWITGDVGRLSSSCRRISYRPGLRYSYFGFRVVCLVVAVR